MSLLRFMEIRRKVDAKVYGFEYSFADDVIEGYSGQDHVQAEAAIQLAVDASQGRNPAAKKVIIQSDNASGFSSQELFLFILNMNNIIDDEKLLC